MTEPLPTLDDADVAILSGHFTGARLTMFTDSIAVIRASAEQGTWLSHGRRRADKGINKGLTAGKHMKSPGLVHGDARREALWRVYFAAQHGQSLRAEELDVATDDDLQAIAPKISVEVTRAWLRLMVVLRDIYTDLDASRPLPVYTEIGLSPKVTATLQDIGIDLDLATRRMAPIDWRWEQERDKNFALVFRSDGAPKMVKVYFVKWPAGTVFGLSRFADRDCEACGKSIPSGRFVPVLIANKAGTEHGFWFGCDCARNILGIKDAGISRGGAEG
jgi:hypothetical protein